MNARRHPALAWIVLATSTIALASCGGSEPDAAGDPAAQSSTTVVAPGATGITNSSSRPTTVGTSTTTVLVTTAPADTQPPVSVETATTVVTEPPAPTTTLGTPLVAGLAQIVLVQPAPRAAATTPLFEWQPIASAARYRLVVGGPAGPIWAWEGTATSVRLGGLAGERPASFGGPQIVTGSSWSVAALDAADAVVAVSELRQVGPA